jgi:ribosomal protein S18 acetylase RimI-like enzyme
LPSAAFQSLKQPCLCRASLACQKGKTKVAIKERQMTPEIFRDHIAKLSVETVDQLTERDIHELSDAAEAAILAGGGFGWLSPPPKSVMEDYWRGVQMIPDRHLILARLDKVIAGSCQIVHPPKNNEAQKFACQLTTFFVAPWARGHGLAQMIVAEAEALAKSEGFLMINLDVRATQDRAIQSFEARNFKRYATNDHYAKVDGAYVPGYYYHKEL